MFYSLILANIYFVAGEITKKIEGES